MDVFILALLHTCQNNRLLIFVILLNNYSSSEDGRWRLQQACEENLENLEFDNNHLILMLLVKLNCKTKMGPCRFNHITPWRTSFCHFFLCISSPCVGALSQGDTNRLGSSNRVCGMTGSAAARSWRGYGFNSRPKPRHS